MINIALIVASLLLSVVSITQGKKMASIKVLYYSIAFMLFFIMACIAIKVNATAITYAIMYISLFVVAIASCNDIRADRQRIKELEQRRNQIKNRVKE